MKFIYENKLLYILYKMDVTPVRFSEGQEISQKFYNHVVSLNVSFNQKIIPVSQKYIHKKNYTFSCIFQRHGHYPHCYALLHSF